MATNPYKEFTLVFRKTTMRPSIIAGLMTYGALRKAIIVKDAKIGSNPDVKVPMLMMDKVGLVAIGGLSAIYLWPIYVYMDMCTYELNARTYCMDKKDADDFKKHYRMNPYIDEDKSIVDFLFK